MAPRRTMDLAQAESEAAGVASRDWRGVTIAWLCGSIAFLAVLTLAGWFFDLPMLRSLLPGTIQMKANTAVCLLLMTAALALRTAAAPGLPRKWVSRSLGMLVMAVGLISLAEYLFNWHTGLDQALFADDPGDIFTRSPGLMAPRTAIAFGLLGLVLTLPQRRFLRYPALAACTAVGLSAALSFLGYLWGAKELTTDIWTQPMAVHSALSQILLAVGLYLCDARFHAADSRAQQGLRAATEAKLLVGFGLAVVLLCIGGGITYRMVVNFASTAQELADSQQRLRGLDQAYEAISDAEAAQRDYLILGDPRYRAQFLDQQALLPRRISTVRAHLLTDSAQRATEAKLEGLLQLYAKLLTRHIEIRRGNSACWSRNCAR